MFQFSQSLFSGFEFLRVVFAQFVLVVFCKDSVGRAYRLHYIARL